MMFNAMGIINLQEDDASIRELTDHRPIAALPFGGRYRLIDFGLSNMVNAGIHNVGILVKDKYRSLTDHLRSGKEWDLARKRDGLFILPPADNYPYNARRQGDVQNLYYHLDYIKSSRQKYVVITGSSVLCNINFKKVFEYHLKKQADVTVIYKPLDRYNADCTNVTLLDIGPDHRVLDMCVNPEQVNSVNSSMNMYIIDKCLLVSLIDNCVSRGGCDFVIDCLLKNLYKYKVYGYCYDGYIARINSIQSYYQHNINLLSPDIWRELFFSSGLIYTRVKDAAPAKYKENALLHNTLVANGCVIEGKVENSVLFRGVRVQKNANIKNSVIMTKCIIGEDVILENVICDKGVVVTTGKHLKGEKNYPLVIKKGSVI